MSSINSSATEQLVVAKNVTLEGLYGKHSRVPRAKEGRHWKHAGVRRGEEARAREHGAYARSCRFQNHRRCVAPLVLVARPAHGGRLCRSRLLVRVPATSGGRAAGRQLLVAIPPPTRRRMFFLIRPVLVFVINTCALSFEPVNSVSICS
mgnify:CR=1 FL=1